MDFEDSRIEQARAENESLLTDPRSTKRNKRADRRRRRKYKFSDKHHPKRCIIATALAAAALCLIVLAIVIATTQKGQGGLLVGILPFAALLLATAGIILPCTTFHRSDMIFTFSWISLIANIVIWLFIAFVLVIGL